MQKRSRTGPRSSKRRERQPIVVVSALGGATNKLLQIAEQAAKGQLIGALRAVEGLRDRHLAQTELLLGDDPAACADICGELERDVRRARGPRRSAEDARRPHARARSTPSHRSASSCHPCSSSPPFQRHGLPAEHVDARQVMITDAQFTRAEPQPDAIAEAAQRIVMPIVRAGKIPVMGGFIGSAQGTGVTTTLGRGGSDYSASLVGAALQAEAIEIWSADIILLEKSLMVLEEAVIEGRKTFANIIKYIKMTASSNFGNVFSVLVASVFLPFLPMMPIQLLTQNLLYDISQVSIPWDDVDKDFLKQPRKWDAGGIARFMVFIGPISSIFDILTFILMWHVFGANSIANQSLFQSGWFVVGLLTQTLIVHMIRTQHIPSFRAAPRRRSSC